MIKGKFYAGLPSEMMTRSRTVDRQQTNFYWPDETDAESATPTTRAKRIGSKSITPNNNINNNSIDAITTTTQSDIKPKELVRKQLSSGIEFYDNVNAKTPESRRRRFKKIDNINLNNINNDNDFQPEKKKLETFSSKIEFYDFATENCNDSVKKSEKKEKIDKPVVGKAINVIDDNEEHRRIDGGGGGDGNKKSGKMDSPDVGKKRISFQTTEKPVEKTKSILKNSDEKPNVDKFIVKPLPKRGLLPKNLSKSVENISKMAKNMVEDDLKGNKEPEKLSTIIKEVKKMNLESERKKNYERYAPDEDDDGYYRHSTKNAYEREPRRNNIDKEYSSRYTERYANYDRYRDEPDNYKRYDTDERKYRSDVARNNYRNDDRRGRDRDYMDYDRYERPERDYRPPLRDYDDKRYKERSRRYDDEPIRGRYSPEYDGRTTEREYERTTRRDGHYESRTERKSSPSKIQYKDEYSTAISRPTKHLPQHLQTNILSNGHVRPQSQRPLSVRDSAVTRVGVGLPDIE